jgi:hypothetical protein
MPIAGRDRKKALPDAWWRTRVRRTQGTTHLAVDQARPHLERVDGFDDERIARRPVVAVAGEQANTNRIAPRHQAIAVMLDLVDPVRAGRRTVGG